MTTENENAAVDVAPTRSLFASGATATVADVAPVENENVEPVAESAEVVEEPIVESVEAEPVEQNEAPVPTETAPAEPAPVETPVEVAPVEPVAEPVPEAPAAPASPAGETKSLKDLQAEKDALESQITQRQNAEKKKVIAQIAAVVKTYSISVTELAAALGGVPNPRKGVKAPVLYRDGTNEWSGRGKLPKWLAGKNPEDYRVK